MGLLGIVERTHISDELYPDVARYLCGLIDGVDFRLLLSDHGFDRERISIIKRELDGHDLTLSKLWRAAFQEAEGNRKAALRLVEQPDIDFLRRQLTETDWKKLQRKALAMRDYMKRYRFGPGMLAELTRYCWSIAKERLGFIVRSDPALSYQDMVHEMMLAGLSALRWCDWDQNHLRLKHRIFKSVRNRVSNLISHYTAHCRRRMVASYGENGERIFNHTTIHLADLGDSENRFLENKAIPELDSFQKTFETRENIEAVFSRLTWRERMVCQAFLGAVNGMHEPNMTDRQYMRTLCKFYKVSLPRMQRKLRKCYEEII